jgi:sulfate transport system permease protein
VVLISGNKPFDTQVSSVFISKQIESDATASAAAVSVVLLAVALLVLFGLRLVEHWGSRHAR